MRRIEALRAYCADLGNIDPVTLKGTQLVVRHLARIRERDRNITKYASDYPGQQSEATQIVTCVSKAILRSGDLPLTHAPRMTLVKRPHRARKHGRIEAFHATDAAWHLLTVTKLLGLETPQGAQFACGITRASRGTNSTMASQRTSASRLSSPRWKTLPRPRTASSRGRPTLRRSTPPTARATGAVPCTGP